MGRAAFMIFFGLFFIFLDVYTYNGMAGAFANGRYSRLFRYVYLALSAFTYFSILQLILYFIQGQTVYRTAWFNFMSGFVFTMFVSKLLFCIILILQDSGRLFYGGISYTKSLFTGDSEPFAEYIPGRRNFITTFGTVIAGIPFFSMLYGITRGKYQYTVEKQVLRFSDLPDAFDGLKIVQISDIHAGSFDSVEKVRSGIEMINQLKPDIVCMTGDLVNSEKEEIDPYIPVFKEIQATYGKFAVLGNHDYYGTYDRSNKQAESDYFSDFFKRFEEMGFSLLNNENRKITKDEQSLHIVGVENWGAGRWFPKKGDLDAATSGMTRDAFSVLLSHDPTHWDEKVKAHPQHVHLTLSGHTHGFQFGFQMPGFKWSPAQYRYEKWLGLYEEKNQYLYVNRGFGFLGFPGRVGMWPEITLFELRKA